VVSIEKKTQEKGFFRSEFRYGNFQRVIPASADPERAGKG